VVATDVGDVRWLIDSTEGGLCVAKEDEPAFTEACGRVLGDNDLRRRLGEAGSVGVVEFDAPRMAERYAEVFEAAIAGGPLPALVLAAVAVVLMVSMLAAVRLGIPLAPRAA